MYSPTRFRTWKRADLDTYDCTIVEAARATSAAPTYFKGIRIKGRGATGYYVDGGLLCNNPIHFVLDEAEFAFSSHGISSIVSLGTGAADVIQMSEPNIFYKVLPFHLIDVLKGLATDCEKESRRVARRFTNVKNFYFRFNVTQGLQEISLADWRKLSKVEAHTKSYLEEPRVVQDMHKLAEVLTTRPSVIHAKHLSEIRIKFFYSSLDDLLKSVLSSPRHKVFKRHLRL